MPEEAQEIIYERPPPILLQCPSSPHIYLLEKGEKRWIEAIETFNDRGYLWRDVQRIGCDDLRNIPDAGPPPQP